MPGAGRIVVPQMDQAGGVLPLWEGPEVAAGGGRIGVGHLLGGVSSLRAEEAGLAHVLRE